MKMRMECPACGHCSFGVEMDAKKLNDFVLVCEGCGEHIATIKHYAINWAEDDEYAKDSY